MWTGDVMRMPRGSSFALKMAAEEPAAGGRQ